MNADRAIALVQRIYEEGFNGGDESVFDRCYTPGFTHHSKTVHDVAPGPAGEKGSMRRFRSAIPDVHFELLEWLTGPQTVAVRLRITGHPEAAFGDIPPGGALCIHAMALFGVEGDRVAEEWFFVDARR